MLPVPQLAFLLLFSPPGILFRSPSGLRLVPSGSVASSSQDPTAYKAAKSFLHPPVGGSHCWTLDVMLCCPSPRDMMGLAQGTVGEGGEP